MTTWCSAIRARSKQNNHPFDPETSLRPICWDLFPAGDPRNGFLEFTRPTRLTLAGSGDDTVYGQDGDDLLMGEQGKDILYGGHGDDILIGGSNVTGSLDSDDRIDGGAGNDAIAATTRTSVTGPTTSTAVPGAGRHADLSTSRV